MATTNDSLTAGELTALVLKCGEYGVKVMALLDKANTSRKPTIPKKQLLILFVIITMSLTIHKRD